MFKLPDRLPPSAVAILIIAAFLAGGYGGYALRINQEDVAAAVVVLEDVLVSIGIREEHTVRADRIEDLKNAPELEMLDDCYTRRLPFNFNPSLQSDFN